MVCFNLPRKSLNGSSLALFGPCNEVLMDKATLYPDLEPIAAKASYRQIFDLFYTVAQVRYATFKQLHPLNHRVATKNNLVRMIELGYLSDDNLVKAYHITEKTKEMLKGEGYNTKILSKSFTGQSLDHALKITDTILKLQAQEYFYNVFYPVLDGPLIPDFAVVWKNENLVKLQFCEVEESKPDHENYLLVKRDNYINLAQIQRTYSQWWKVKSEQLNIPLCKEEDFCFSVVCFGNIKREWDGWIFQ
jgi:hypothetical protein